MALNFFILLIILVSIISGLSLVYIFAVVMDAQQREKLNDYDEIDISNNEIEITDN